MRFYCALLATSMRASMSKRGAFLIQSGLMMANNLIFIAIWWIFFQQFDTVAGWNFHDMRVLMAVGLSGYGLARIFFGGVKNISKYIVSGDLDSFLTQPKNVLLHIAGSESSVKGWGHLFAGVAMTFAMVSQDILLIALLSVCACFVYTSAHVIAHSLPFWFGSIEGISKKYCDSLFLFALYPTNIYSGVLQVVMFTVIPAGVISYMPVELVRNFSLLQLGYFLGLTAFFVFLAFFVFYRGLKRYESGNRFGVRA